MPDDVYNNNVSFFKRTSPQFFEQYRDYRPSELILHANVGGYLNLVNIGHEHIPVYKGDPKAFCQTQVANFIKRPRVSSIRYTPSPITNPKHFHVPRINALINEAQQYADMSEPHSSVPIGTLIVTGCGLGYHIRLLVEKLDIYNLVIFDPHKDSFFASLHTIDWEPIVRFFQQKGRSLQLLIGVPAQDAIVALQAHSKKMGLHNVVHSFHYTHLNSGPSQAFTEAYKAKFHLNAMGVGFFDDEQVGLAHTVANLSRKTCVFRADCRSRGLPPAFVIANGPSLDQHIDFIKQNMDHVIVISCGTAIASLFKAGIKPDFHVEMERNISIKEWIEAGTTPAYRKGITLLCLNTAAPEVLDLFDDYCMAKKPNDIGETLIDHSLNGVKVEPLQLCNPTVANAGLSFSLAVGFKKVYLLGIDLGIKSLAKHHSKLSIYYDLERSTKTAGHSEFEKVENNYFIPANFGGEISTNPFFDSTRVNMEILLRHYQNICNDVDCYNMNDGAFIAGTLPLRQENMALPFAAIDKKAVIDSIKNYHFIKSFKPNYDYKAEVIKQLSILKSQRGRLSLPETVDSPADVYRNVSNVYTSICALREQPIAQHLLIGSINEFLSNIVKATLFQTDVKTMKAAYRVGYQAYMGFLDCAYAFMAQSPFQLDDTRDNIVQKLACSIESS